MLATKIANRVPMLADAGIERFIVRPPPLRVWLIASTALVKPVTGQRLGRRRIDGVGGPRPQTLRGARRAWHWARAGLGDGDLSAARARARDCRPSRRYRPPWRANIPDAAGSAAR